MPDSEIVTVSRIGVTPERIADALDVLNNESYSLDDLGNCVNLIDVLGEFHKQAKAMLKVKMLARAIEQGPFMLGPVKYYAAKEKTTKCRDAMKTITTILEVSGGELDLVADCLGSSPFKYGFIRKLLAEKGKSELFDQCFEVVERDELAKKELQSVNTNFLK